MYYFYKNKLDIGSFLNKEIYDEKKFLFIGTWYENSLFLDYEKIRCIYNAYYVLYFNNNILWK